MRGALFIQTEQEGLAYQIWPALNPLPENAVQEAKSYLLELRDCPEAPDAELFIDDVPLEALRVKDPRTARWRWTPGFHAGAVDAILKLAPGLSYRFQWITDPARHKITREQFDTMVHELLQDTQALFSLSAFRRGLGKGTNGNPPPLARLEYLRTRGGEIVEAVNSIAASPRQVLRAHEEKVSRHRVRRVSGPEIVRSFRNAKLDRETRKPSALPAVLRGHLPAELRVRNVKSSVDILEHRVIKGCLTRWSTWLSVTADRLEAQSFSMSKDSQRKVLAAAWAVRTRSLARTFSRLLQNPVFSEAGPLEPSAHLTELFRKDSRYSRFYRLQQDFNLGIAAIFGDFLDMPLARTYDLYELWCFLRLVRAAVGEWGEEGLNVEELFLPDKNGGLTIPRRAISVPVGKGWKLCFQRTFREYWAESDGVGSFTRDMTPDIIAVADGSGDAAATLIIIDAKYRAGEALNDAVSSIHTYRDAIIREDKGEVHGVVSAAYLVTPDAPMTPEKYQESKMPTRLFHPTFRQDFRFGAVTLHPGMGTEEFRTALRIMVSDATRNVIKR